MSYHVSVPPDPLLHVLSHQVWVAAGERQVEAAPLVGLPSHLRGILRIVYTIPSYVAALDLPTAMCTSCPPR